MPDQTEFRQHTGISPDNPLTEEKFNEAFQFNEQIIRCAQEGIILYDKNLRYKAWNPFMENLSGLKAREVIGKTPVELFPDLEKVGIMDSLKKALCGAPVSSIDFPFTHLKTGKLGWINDVISPLRNSEGTIIGAISIINDMTDRIESEKALIQANQALLKAKEAAEKNEEKFRVMIKNSNDSFVLINAQGEQFYISDAAARDSGFTIEELKGPIQKVIYPEDLGIVLKAWNELLNSKDTLIRVQYRHIHKHKKYIWYEAVAQNFLDNPLINAVVVNVRDITPVKEAEAQLIQAKEEAEKNEQLYKLIYNSTPVLMHTVNLNGLITAVNDYWLQSLGFDLDEVLGTPSIRYLTEESKKLYINQFSELLQKGKLTNVEARLVKKNGEIIDVLVSSRTLYDSFGNPLQFMTTLLDITERKRTEGALQNVQKLESLGILAGGIAHDFNNLLGSIFGNIDLAAATTQDSQVSGFLSEALSTIDRARGLTRQLLTFAKGGAPVKKTESLIPFIQETAKFALSGSKVSCQFDIPPNLWLCEYDKTQIGQVIDNIVINAQQAMPDGGTIEIAAKNLLLDHSRSGLSAGNYVLISITDHGIGMPKEIIPRIFDPFFTTKAKGHGLGLATCYSIITRHGGLLEAESRPGKGSTFTFYLPATSQTPCNSSPQPQPLLHGTGTILVMDDEEIIRNTFSSMLQFLGYTPLCLKDGKETLDYLTAEFREGIKIKAMILDLTVPGGMNGLDVITRIRKMDSKLPVFVVSGYADDPVMADPKHYGFNDSLCKPFKITDLAAMLNKNIS